MAVLDVVQTKWGAAGAGTLVVTFDSNVTAGNTLIVWPIAYAGVISTVTDSQGNTYSAGPQSTYYAIAGSTGACAVTVVITVAGGVSAQLYELEGTLVDGLFNGGSGTGATWTTGQITTSQAARMVARAVCISNDTVNAPASGWTSVIAGHSGQGLFERYMYSDTTTAGTYEANGTLTNTPAWGANIVEFKQTGGSTTWPGYVANEGWFRKRTVGWRKSLGGLFIPPQVSLA